MSGHSDGVRPVQVVAHRGSSAAHPEHTLAAYELAIEEGVDALECDIRLTRDGVLVCVHDRRVDRTSDGRGVVSTLDLADLAELDFASWKAHHPERWTDAPTGEQERRRVLTLERLLQLTIEHPPVSLHIETKHPTRYAGLVERALVDLLARYGLADPPRRRDARVTVMSFAPVSLRRVRALAAGLPTVLLLPRLSLRYRDGWLPPRVGIAGPSLDLLRTSPDYVQRAQGAGHRVHVWTVDEEEDIAFVLGLGVDAVISNHPLRVLRQLGRA